MEKVSEFFDELKSRLSSPFIFSFFISWLLWNWKISLGLLWYNSVELNATGFSTVWDFILKNSNYLHSLVFPFASALAYPWLKYLSTWYVSYVAKVGEGVNYNITAETHIRYTEYVALRKEYEAQKKDLQDIIDNQSKDRKENEDLKKTVAYNEKTYKKTKDELKEAESMLQKITDSTPLLGIWKVGKNSELYEFNFRKDEIIVRNLTTNHTSSWWVDNYFFDPAKLKLTFQRKPLNGGAYFTNTLNVKNEGKKLEGVENGEAIAYDRRI